MAKKYQYGIGLHYILLEGMLLSTLIFKIRELRAPIDGGLVLHNLYENHSLHDKSKQAKNIAENIKSVKSYLSVQVAGINETIKKINKTLKWLDFSHRVPILKISKIMGIVRDRLQVTYEEKKGQKPADELFYKRLADEFAKPIKSIEDFRKNLKEETYHKEIQKLSEPYQSGLEQASDVCSIGYYSTAVFIAGRTMEELVNDYCNGLFKAKKLDKFDLNKMSFEDKIGKLKGSKFINESLYHRLSQIRIDRNEFAHPSSKILNKSQAHLRIRSIIDLIPEVKKTIAKKILSTKKQA